MTKIFVLAGEASGDFLGACLMQDLKKMTPDLEFVGVGGPQMSHHGLNSLFPYEDLSLMGIWEVLPHLRLLKQRLNQTLELIDTQKPDVVVTIDVPGFSKRVHQMIRHRGLKTRQVHYVAPQVWAWRPGRANAWAQLVDHMLCLFPFEPSCFKAQGLKSTFVGHPVMRMALPQEQTRQANQLCLLPGSRVGEIQKLLPIFLETSLALKDLNPTLVVPTLPHLKDQVAQQLKNFSLPYEIVGPDQKWHAFMTSHVALAASGTVTLELARANLPCVVSYRLSPLSYLLGKWLVNLKHISLVNILDDFSQKPGSEPILTELIQGACAPEPLSQALRKLWVSDVERARILKGYAKILQGLDAAPLRLETLLS